MAGAGFFRGSECGEAFRGPGRSHEQWCLEGGQGQESGEGGRQALAPPCTCPCSASPPKAFANLPLNILPSRDHPKCHFWLGNQLHRVTGPVAFPPQQEQEARSGKPAGLESCRPGGQRSVSVTARHAVSPQSLPGTVPLRAGAPREVCTCPHRPPQTSQWNVRSPSRSEDRTTSRRPRRQASKKRGK